MEHAENPLGISVPLEGVPWSGQAEILLGLERLGYSEAWSSEASALDAFTPLAYLAGAGSRMRMGTAVVPAYLRGPALLAMTTSSLASLLPGRFTLGLGTSSDVIVERWNSIPFEKPYQRVRDTLWFLRRALAGERVDEAWETFEVRGFRLERPPEVQPPILLGALRPGMLRLAGREADGAIINWLGSRDVPRVVAEIQTGAATPPAAASSPASAAPVATSSPASGPPAPSPAAPATASSELASKQVVGRIFCCPSTDAHQVRTAGRMLCAAYLNVEVYARFHEWLGRGPLLEEMWRRWQQGDRKGALSAIPDEVVDALIIHGTSEQCAEQIRAYVDNGVTTPLVALLPFGIDVPKAAKDLITAWTH
jgi:probable F420-dependent oxidoreductase